MSVQIITGDCRAELAKLPAESVHCCVTSPPYFGLRDYGVDGQIGLDESLEAYIETMVAVFREVKRVLRKDGTVWLNLGDSYAREGGKTPGVPRHWDGRKQDPGGLHDRKMLASEIGFKPKDLMMIPARVALALQADGWWLRSDIIWAKPNPMPESCTDRPTSAHEHMFLLSKSAKYYFDAEAVREAPADTEHTRSRYKYAPSSAPKHDQCEDTNREAGDFAKHWGNGSRNLRNVWNIAAAPFSEAHFATFPPKLVEPCIKAGTSEKGCCGVCGAPWVRDVERSTDVYNSQEAQQQQRRCEGAISGGTERVTLGVTEHVKRQTLGWSPSCACHAKMCPDWTKPAAVPCTVLDPFGGAGTTGLVADRLGRNAVLIELNPDYAEMARRRISDDAPLFASADLIPDPCHLASE